MNLKTITAAVAALCLLAASASAQEAPASAWTDPLGRFTLDLASHGFTPLPQGADANVVLEAENAALQRNANEPRVCAVNQQRLPRVVALDQGEANARLYDRTERDLATALRGDVTEYARARMGGISTAAFRLDANGSQYYGRMFFLAHNGGVVQVAVTCGGAAPLSMLDASVMTQTLSTLRFLPEARP
jgi:hypothetical protein